jgi:hypothetical protein
MTDLRNNGFSDSAPIVSEEILRTDNGFGEQHVLNDNGGLSGFHHFEEAEEGGNKGKLIGGALVVALLLGAAGIYAYTGSGSTPVTMAAKAPASSVASNTPAPIQTAPIAAPAAAPASDATSGTTTKSPYDAAPAASAPADTAGATPDVKADKPVKSARAHVMKDDASQNSAEAQQTAQLNKDNSAADRATKNGSVAVPLPAASPSDTASATPLPTPPAPPASSVASNGQPVTSESSTPAQDVPAAPAVTPEQQPATPAPQPDQAAQPQAQPQ